MSEELDHPSEILDSQENKLSEHSDVNSDLRLRLIIFTAELGEKEADRLWKRYGIMLTLNAGLIAIVSYTFSQSLYLLTAFIGFFGVFLSIFWYRIAAFSQFYEARWRSDMAALIDEDPYFREVLRSRSSLGPRLKRPFKGSSTGDAKIIVCGVGVFWFVVMIYSLIKT
jgi:hypothetical protein